MMHPLCSSRRTFDGLVPVPVGEFDAELFFFVVRGCEDLAVQVEPLGEPENLGQSPTGKEPAAIRYSPGFPQVGPVHRLREYEPDR